MTLRFRIVVSHVWLSLVFAASATGQESAEDLHRVVADLDGSVFSAFNERDLDRFMAFFSENLEFYHDRDGLSGHAEMIENSRRLFGQENPLRRDVTARFPHPKMSPDQPSSLGHIGPANVPWDWSHGRGPGEWPAAGDAIGTAGWRAIISAIRGSRPYTDLVFGRHLARSSGS